MTEFLTDHLKSTRDAFKHHVHGGKRFSSDEITALLGCFDELIAMADDLENDLSRHQWNEAARTENPATQTGNVVLFPNIRRHAPLPPRGGGDAA